MIDYIIVVSTPEAGSRARGPLTPTSSDKHERLRIMNALRHRSATAPVLHREAIPLLPHLLDIPRHLAVVTSVVVRYSRTQNFQPSKQTDPDDKYFADFCSRCMEVEEQALFRVSKLAAKPRRQHSEPVIMPVPPLPTSPSPLSPSTSWKLPTRERKISASLASPTKRPRPRKTGRPSTAPSSSETDDTRSRRSESSNAEPRSPTHPPLPSPLPTPPASADVFEERIRNKRPPLVHHPRSTSTDSPLARKPVPEPLLSPMSDGGADPTDDGKRRRNIFRSILTRR